MFFLMAFLLNIDSVLINCVFFYKKKRGYN